MIYEISCQYFSQPYSEKEKISDNEITNMKLWRSLKNNHRTREAREKGIAINSLNREIALSENECEKIGPLVHPFDDTVFFSSDPDTVVYEIVIL